VAEYLKRAEAPRISVLLVEQKLTIALEFSERCLVMGHGQIVLRGHARAERPQRPTSARSGSKV
jgi:ABC-type branched-subunit amino acid transport system ATPase component